MKDRKKIKIAIVVLSVLLAISLLVLGGKILRNLLSEGKGTRVMVPANVITDEKQPGPAQTDDGAFGDGAASIVQNENRVSAAEAAPASSETAQPDESAAANSAQSTNANAADETTIAPSATAQSGGSAVEAETIISLHARNADDNTPFRVGNMFPGDRETKYYCVRVSHNNDVTLCFRADVRPGYEKLAEVLFCRVVLPEKNKVLYDGLMRDMPIALEQTLKASGSTKSEVFYEIAAYLETSVGNEYMNKSLIADFRWWVSEREHLDTPYTGDSSNINFWICMAAGSLLLLLLMIVLSIKGGRSQ